jgi:hypothetical protein
MDGMMAKCDGRDGHWIGKMRFSKHLDTQTNSPKILHIAHVSTQPHGAVACQIPRTPTGPCCVML